MKVLVYILEVAFILKCAQGQLLSSIEALEDKVKNLRAKVNLQTSFAGFSARITEDFTAPINSVVPFNQANVNNPTDVYNTVTGVFTCPVTGYYYFAVSAFSNNNYNNIALAIKRPGQNDVDFVAAFEDKAHWDQGSTQYVIQCNEGDTVFAQQLTNGKMVASVQNGFVNALSGFLLRPL